MTNVKRAAKNRYMLDIETLGTRAGSVIFEIGCAKFAAGSGVTAAWRAEVSLASCRAAGLTSDSATEAWWRGRSPAERETLERCLAGGGVPLREALEDLGVWLGAHGAPDEMWGNGCDFDNALMAEAYARVFLPVPWRYRANQSLRTARLYLPAVDRPFRGTPHRALDDAAHEAECLLAMEEAARLRADSRRWAVESAWQVREGVATGRLTPEGEG